MTFDPEQLPLADFGLICQHCGYPIAGITRLQCPECGKPVDLADYLPEGAMPPLYARGQQVRLTDEIAELFERYAIPYVEENDSWGLLPGMSVGRLRERGRVAVARTHYFEAIDLLRRWELHEPMPDPPPPGQIKGIDWACAACGEENPGHFEVCWNCGAERG